MNPASPFEHDILGDEIQHFEKCLVVGENGLAFGDLAQLPMVALYHIGSVNELANFWRVFKESRKLGPVALPGLNHQRIPLAPNRIEVLQHSQSRFFTGRSVNGLESCQQLFRIFVGHIPNGVSNLMDDAFLDFGLGEAG